MTSALPTHLLSNLWAGLYYDLPVEEGADVTTAARTFLSDLGLTNEVQRGFYISVYPTTGTTGTGDDVTDPAAGSALSE